jgi:hypothetical protein
MHPRGIAISLKVTLALRKQASNGEVEGPRDTA